MDCLYFSRVLLFALIRRYLGNVVLSPSGHFCGSLFVVAAYRMSHASRVMVGLWNVTPW
jgi:hypothetical protein